ncbi:MAG: hypothetical protein JKY20_08105 [Alphaproteobacteria bacterium]|nr:hypothetical protein [Alphaproteobacteria bacterium]
MTRLTTTQTNFTAGEISTRLLGRADLTAYANGARRLRNVFIHPTGGVRRRPGLRFIGAEPDAGRLVAFEFNMEQTYLLVLSELSTSVYMDDSSVATIATPWTCVQLAQIVWTQSADTLLICHPEVAPQKITRTSHTSWVIEPWRFFEESGSIKQPHYKFAADDVTIQSSAISGSVTLTASADVFDAGHVGTRMRFKGKDVEITAVASPLSASADVKVTLAGAGPTTDWTEQAFSPVRGQPVSVTFHQDRLVIGGSRDLPNRLWLSKSADLFNFDLGSGADDEAIEFAILSDQVNAIRAVFSGRHLQIFTSGAEWMVTGDPLTPVNIQLSRQTREGSPIDRAIPPRDVDGATLFLARQGSGLREFLFTDSVQAYQSNDLAILARHLIVDPVDQDFDPDGRLLHIVMADGGVATVTIFRAEQVTAWTLQSTEGAALSVAVVAGQVYLLVQRANGIFVEVMDESVQTDSALVGTSASETISWSGLDHLEGLAVRVVADGIDRGLKTVSGGAIALAQPANTVEAGLSFAHEIEPLPPVVGLDSGRTQNAPVRLIKATFRLENSAALRVDTGLGFREIPFKKLGATGVLDSPVQPFTGDKSVRALGWRRGGVEPLWRVQQDTPAACTILSVLTEIKVGGS